MWFPTLIVALLWALALVGIFAIALHQRGPWGNIWSFFLAVFVFAWAAGVWVYPVGPAWWGVSWMPVICIGLLIALLLAAVPSGGRPSRRIRGEPVGSAESQETEEVVVGTLFWVFVVLMLLVIFGSYWHTPYI